LNQSSALLHAVKVVAAGAGLFLVTLGLLGGAIYLIELFSANGSPLDSTLITATFAALGLGLGGALAWHGGRSILKYSSANFAPPATRWLILIFVVAVAGGQLVLSFDIFPALIFPPFHLVAAAIPPFAVLVFAGRAFKAAAPRWREVVTHLAGGAFLSTSVAFVAEIIIGAVILLVMFSLAALTPNGRAFFETLSQNLQDPLWLENPDNLQQLLLFPPVAITLGLVFVLLAPMVEELTKLIGVALMSYRRPNLAQALLWGLASGAGFALVENLFNTVLALEVWAFIMLLRVGGTAMHTLGSGLMALGWQQLLAGRGVGRLLGSYALSVTIHALWNGAIIGITMISVLVVDPPSQLTLTVGGTIIVLLVALLVILSVGLIAGLIYLTRRLKTGLETAPQTTTGPAI